jgi:hypothetical protein
MSLLTIVSLTLSFILLVFGLPNHFLGNIGCQKSVCDRKIGQGEFFDGNDRSFAFVQYLRRSSVKFLFVHFYSI